MVYTGHPAYFMDRIPDHRHKNKRKTPCTGCAQEAEYIASDEQTYTKDAGCLSGHCIALSAQRPDQPGGC